jgi:hypothetical protein
MSHFTEVKTKMTDKTILQSALKQLGFVIEEEAEGVQVRGFMKESQPADFKILTKTHYDIGFVKGETGYELVGDWELLPKVSGIEKDLFAKAIKREYAKTAVLEIARANGYEVKTSESAEGTDNIEMVVSKW